MGQTLTLLGTRAQSKLTMASYFSNHAHSRFLANSSSTNQTATITQTPAMPTPPPSRSRLPSSKHFSTSVSDEKPNIKERTLTNATSNGTSGVHPLRNTYVRIASHHGCFRLDLRIAGYFGFASNAPRAIKSRITRKVSRRYQHLVRLVLCHRSMNFVQC